MRETAAVFFEMQRSHLKSGTYMEFWINKLTFLSSTMICRINFFQMINLVPIIGTKHDKLHHLLFPAGSSFSEQRPNLLVEQVPAVLVLHVHPPRRRRLRLLVAERTRVVGSAAVGGKKCKLSSARGFVIRASLLPLAARARFTQPLREKYTLQSTGNKFTSWRFC